MLMVDIRKIVFIFEKSFSQLLLSSLRGYPVAPQSVLYKNKSSTSITITLIYTNYINDTIVVLIMAYQIKYSVLCITFIVVERTSCRL